MTIGITAKVVIKAPKLPNNVGQIPLDMAIRNEKIFRMVLIDFLSFALKTKDFKKDEFQKKLWDTLDRFCVKSNSGVTLFQYIAEKGMVKEREELLQLLIKMDKHKHKENYIQRQVQEPLKLYFRTRKKFAYMCALDVLLKDFSCDPLVLCSGNLTLTYVCLKVLFSEVYSRI